MKGTYLRFYMHENRKHHGVLLYEWLLETAKKAGIHGGSAFRAIAGYGRHGVLHEQHFFELAGDLTVEVEFLLSDEQGDMLLGVLKRERVRVFYAKVPAEFGMLEGKDASDP
jgi:PII-like signaling protein